MINEIPTPELEYKSRQNIASNGQLQLEITDGRISMLRALVFVVFCVVAYLCLFAESLSLPWLIIPAVVFAGCVFVHNGVNRKLDSAKRLVKYYQNCLSRLQGQWQSAGVDGERYRDKDHPYSDDLDIFGKQSLFQLLTLARTRKGEDTLASWLSNTAGKEEIQLRQQAIEELRNQLDEREVFGLLDDNPLPNQVDENGLLFWAQRPFPEVSNSLRIIACALSLLTLTAILIYSFTNTGPGFLLLAIAIQLVVVRSFKIDVKSVEREVDRVSQRLKMLILVLERLETHSFQSVKLKKNCQALYTSNLPPSVQVTRLGNLIQYLSNCIRNPFMVFPAMLLCLPMHLIHFISRWHAMVSSHIPQWVEAVGEYEALSSLAGYAYEHPDDPFPTLTSSGNCFIGKQIGHPLIPNSDCVRNDFVMEEPLSLVMASGSNMSGKSTLLRTIGINMVLANSGSVVTAGSLQLSVFSPVTCMRINDSLQTNTSYFYAVISRLKLILELVENTPQVFFFLDEILSGTNSHDRRIGAERIITQLIDKGAMGLVTTHDLALTDIAEKLHTAAKNIHFEDQLIDGVMSFDYKIKGGVVEKSNALALMQLMGIDVSERQ